MYMYIIPSSHRSEDGVKDGKEEEKEEEDKQLQAMIVTKQVDVDKSTSAKGASSSGKFVLQWNLFVLDTTVPIVYFCVQINQPLK